MSSVVSASVPVGRRERKKAATRRGIADAALRLFRAHGYESVGIRDIAAEADVAVTTLFAHFPSKEALVFEQAAGFEERLRLAVVERDAATTAVDGLHREIGDLVRHCTTGDATGIWRMIDDNEDLSAYAQVLEVRYARAIAAAIDDAPDLAMSPFCSEAVSRFAMAAFTIARRSAAPQEALDQSFRMIGAAWDAATASR